MIRNLMLRYHRWRVWRTAGGTPERHRAVAAYLRWHHHDREGR